MRAIFFGTPELAVPSLDALASVAEVVLVVTQPDRPAGRGMRLRSPPVKERAEELSLDVIQPLKVRTGELAARLARLEADVALVIAYGRILPRPVLDAPRLGCVNVHASLLPRWRGAAPIQWAIAHGDARSGVCLMRMDEGLDTGPVLECLATDIGANETAGELGERLSHLAASLVRDALPRFVHGELIDHPQSDADSTLAPLLTKEDGRVDWRASAHVVHDRARGMTPAPGAFTTLDGTRIKVHATRVAPTIQSGGRGPGTIVSAGAAGIAVACGDGGVVLVTELQLEGKRRMTAAELLAGHRLEAGARLGT